MKTIGIVGGMGATTGIDLANKIIANTIAKNDHDYIPMVLLSYPHQIVDRTEFLQEKALENPAHNIVKIIKKMELLEADVIGIPCNTAHAPRIYNTIAENIYQAGCQTKLINMIEATADFLTEYHPKFKKIGLLATIGTYQSSVYEKTFAQFGLDVITPDISTKNKIHQMIYHTGYGLKSGYTDTGTVRRLLYSAIDTLVAQKVQAIILGCSEIPLMLTKGNHNNIPLFDPTTVLARKLIQLIHPEKLKPIVCSGYKATHLC